MSKKPSSKKLTTQQNSVLIALVEYHVLPEPYRSMYSTIAALQKRGLVEVVKFANRSHVSITDAGRAMVASLQTEPEAAPKPDEVPFFFAPDSDPVMWSDITEVGKPVQKQDDSDLLPAKPTEPDPVAVASFEAAAQAIVDRITKRMDALYALGGQISRNINNPDYTTNRRRCAIWIAREHNRYYQMLYGDPKPVGDPDLAEQGFKFTGSAIVRQTNQGAIFNTIKDVMEPTPVDDDTALCPTCNGNGCEACNASGRVSYAFLAGYWQAVATGAARALTAANQRVERLETQIAQLNSREHYRTVQNFNPPE